MLASLLLVAPARANESFATERVEVTLLSEVNSLPSDGGTIWFALRQEIIPHWHTYWSNPGDSGEPTFIEWNLPVGFEAGGMMFPPPERQPYGPLVNFGYSDEAVFLIPVTVPAGLAPGTEITLAAHVYWLVCEEVCIPENGPVALTLPVANGATTQNLAAADTFTQARMNLPQPSPWEARFDEANGRLRIAVLGAELAAPLREERVTEVTFFPFETGLIDNASPQLIAYGAEGMTLDVASGAMFRRDAPPETLRGLIVIEEMIGGEPLSRAIEVGAPRGVIPPGAASVRLGSSSNFTEMTIGTAILFAVLGGIILNLMPCVFPIVFLKALTFVSVAHEQPWQVRMHGLAYTAGIILSFSLIAALLLVLRAGGAEIGWGFQLQSPTVVAGFALLLFAVGLNLSGVFTIGTSIMGLGGSLAERKGVSGSFFTGVLAVVVAAPCTAPFMGIALGFALTQSPLVGLVTFVALGFGMALPYLFLSFVPALLRLLPRPGAWTERLKQILAVPIYFWVVYLLWVLGQQSGDNAVYWAFGGLIAVGAVAWLFDAAKNPEARKWVRPASVSALIAAMAVALTFLPQLPSAGASAVAGEMPYVEYSEEALNELRGNGESVFLNFTAAWCITCLINERAVFADTDFVDAFEATGATYMKADWTNRDAEISRALERFGRPGVPLYVVYSLGREPQVLPQVLTGDVVLRALDGN